VAKTDFKEEMTERFKKVVDYLKKYEIATKNTEVAKLIGQPLQVVSKLLSGERIITLEQTSELIVNTNIDSKWLLTGEGEMIKGEMEQSMVSEPSPEYGMEFLIKENKFLKDQIEKKDKAIERLWNLFEKGSKKAV
jgi:hypothetical protein